MRKVLLSIGLVIIIGVFAACGNNEAGNNNAEEELAMLDVDFTVPETAEPGEAVELIAEVTYGDETVTDADEVLFEIWETGKQEEGEKIESENQGDGTYTLKYTFEQDGVYEMFAHTTARAMHVMPKKQITIGTGEPENDGDEHGEHSNHEEAHFHTEGFDLHFVEPTDVKTNEATDLITHIMMHEDPFEDASVRYEIWPDADEEAIEWVDATETNAGEYVGEYSFPESGVFHVQIHIQDDEDLHEHIEYEVHVE